MLSFNKRHGQKVTLPQTLLVTRASLLETSALRESLLSRYQLATQSGNKKGRLGPTSPGFRPPGFGTRGATFGR